MLRILRYDSDANGFGGVELKRAIFMMTEYEENIRQKIRILRLEHRHLDDMVNRLQEEPIADQLELVRLKKRKLQLKDLISHLESSLIPDLNA